MTAGIAGARIFQPFKAGDEPFHSSSSTHRIQYAVGRIDGTPTRKLKCFCQAISNAIPLDTNTLTIDLPRQTITVETDGLTTPFDIEPLRKDALMRGLDAVSATLRQYAGDIRAFERTHHATNPWLMGGEQRTMPR